MLILELIRPVDEDNNKKKVQLIVFHQRSFFNSIQTALNSLSTFITRAVFIYSPDSYAKKLRGINLNQYNDKLSVQASALFLSTHIIYASAQWIVPTLKK